MMHNACSFQKNTFSIYIIGANKNAVIADAEHFGENVEVFSEVCSKIELFTALCRKCLPNFDENYISRINHIINEIMLGILIV